jgi:hypothetical protein
MCFFYLQLGAKLLSSQLPPHPSAVGVSYPAPYGPPSQPVEVRHGSEATADQGQGNLSSQSLQTGAKQLRLCEWAILRRNPQEA